MFAVRLSLEIVNELATGPSVADAPASFPTAAN
jgi:hypothetical protein